MLLCSVSAQSVAISAPGSVGQLRSDCRSYCVRSRRMQGYKLGILVEMFRFLSNQSRENEVREHIPMPYDNLFQSILSFSQLFLV